MEGINAWKLYKWLFWKNSALGQMHHFWISNHFLKILLNKRVQEVHEKYIIGFSEKYSSLWQMHHLWISNNFFKILLNECCQEVHGSYINHFSQKNSLVERHQFGPKNETCCHISWFLKILHNEKVQELRENFIILFLKKLSFRKIGPFLAPKWHPHNPVSALKTFDLL